MFACCSTHAHTHSLTHTRACTHTHTDTADTPNRYYLFHSFATSYPSMAPAVFTVLQDDYVMEMCRFGAGELHVVAAFAGGMASQVRQKNFSM